MKWKKTKGLVRNIPPTTPPPHIFYGLHNEYERDDDIFRDSVVQDEREDGTMKTYIKQITEILRDQSSI